LRTLILDEDPIYCAVAEGVLRSLDITDIHAHSDGANAIDLITCADPAYDLILLDLNMPGFDGLAFLRSLAEIRYSGGIVLVSGEKQAILSSASHIASKHGLKIFGALSKPMQMTEMRAALERVRSDTRSSRQGFKPEHNIETAGLQPLLHYQPQVDIRDRSVVGAEALLRCGTHDGLVLGPEPLLTEYATVAQRLDLTARLFDILCADLKTLEEQVGWRSNVSFNIDARVLEVPDLLPMIVAAVQGHGVNADQITIELTEAQLPHDTMRLLEVIARLGMAGFEMSLDDFGTGASNFELLREGAFNEVKLDKSIVHAAAHGDTVSQKFLHIVAEIASTLDLRVVAEGIEDTRDLACMEDLGILIAQGYYFSKPSDLEAFARKLRTENRRMRLAS
jgi:EAL domain-containing protein (putative c-di-GMP-specific phosphodiesterase class I)